MYLFFDWVLTLFELLGLLILIVFDAELNFEIKKLLCFWNDIIFLVDSLSLGNGELDFG